MRIIQIICALVSFITVGLTVDAQTKKDTTVIFKTDIHCPKCKAKVEKNIPFEKGVKDLKVNLKDSTVLLTFRMDKNSVKGLCAALAKCDVKVLGMYSKDGKLLRCKVCKPNNCDKNCTGDCNDSCDRKCETSECKGDKAWSVVCTKEDRDKDKK